MNTADLLNVLLVEDDADQVALVCAQLKEVCISVDSQHPSVKLGVANSLKEAKELLSAVTYDLILLDLFLPDAQNLEGLRELTQLYPATPIIIVSNCWDRGLMVDAIELGAQDYLIKDILDREFLLRAIGLAIERNKREQRLKTLLR